MLLACIEDARGDIINARVEALVNPVNCVGVMGRGLALQFKKAFPGNFAPYKAACERGELAPGRVLTWDRGVPEPRYIVNFPTKIHWRDLSRIEYIEAGLEALIAEVKRLGIRSIAIPPLGCGLGGVPWAEVRTCIESTFSGLPRVQVILYPPEADPGR